MTKLELEYNINMKCTKSDIHNYTKCTKSEIHKYYVSDLIYKILETY